MDEGRPGRGEGGRTLWAGRRHRWSTIRRGSGDAEASTVHSDRRRQPESIPGTRRRGMTMPITSVDVSTGTGRDPCPSCGGRLGGRAGCQSVFDQVSAAAWTSPAKRAVHNLVVDTYAMQHPDEYCRSPKSYAAHLTGLCCALESASDPKMYWAIPRWLDGPASIEKPTVLSRRGRHQHRRRCSSSR
jgi:hypothetical protein